MNVQLLMETSCHFSRRVTLPKTDQLRLTVFIGGRGIKYYEQLIGENWSAGVDSFFVVFFLGGTVMSNRLVQFFFLLCVL